MCNCCGKHVGSKMCGRCKAAVYCSTMCQRAHWNAGHSKICQQGVALQKSSAPLLDSDTAVSSGDHASRITSSILGAEPLQAPWRNPIAFDLQAGVEASLRDLEADARSVPANIAVADRMLRASCGEDAW